MEKDGEPPEDRDWIQEAGEQLQHDLDEFMRRNWPIRHRLVRAGEWAVGRLRRGR